MRTLKAIKPHKYGTRQLTAGEEYEAPDRHALALVATKKARFADKPMSTRTVQPVSAAPPAPEVERVAEAIPAQTSQDFIDNLRLQATQLGINVDGRWGAARLQQEIAQAQAR